MQKSDVPLTHRNLPLVLLQVRELVMARFRPMLNEAGVTEQQWRVLRALLSEGPLEPRQLVEVCCLASPSLVGILARMEDLGLVKRKPFANDQRRLMVSASPKGKRLAARLAPRIEAIYAQLESDMGLEIASALYGTLDAIASSLASKTQTDS